MTFREACAVLGISPSMARREARRAYLKLVKVHPPEKDPAGFQQVRAAWELYEAQHGFFGAVSLGPGQASEPAPPSLEAGGVASESPAVEDPSDSAVAPTRGTGESEPEHAVSGFESGFAPSEPDPGESDPVESDPVESDPVESDPVESDSAQLGVAHARLGRAFDLCLTGVWHEAAVLLARLFDDAAVGTAALVPPSARAVVVGLQCEAGLHTDEAQCLRESLDRWERFAGVRTFYDNVQWAVFRELKVIHELGFSRLARRLARWALDADDARALNAISSSTLALGTLIHNQVSELRSRAPTIYAVLQPTLSSIKPGRSRPSTMGKGILGYWGGSVLVVLALNIIRGCGAWFAETPTPSTSSATFVDRTQSEVPKRASDSPPNTARTRTAIETSFAAVRVALGARDCEAAAREMARIDISAVPEVYAWAEPQLVSLHEAIGHCREGLHDFVDVSGGLPSSVRGQALPTSPEK